MWTRKHGFTAVNLKILELLVKFCLVYYFKLYFDIKVKHHLEDAPYHILTELRILKTLPHKVRNGITFYIRTGAWYAITFYFSLRWTGSLRGGGCSS
jgi:hypothetical protein